MDRPVPAYPAFKLLPLLVVAFEAIVALSTYWEISMP
jgi:hypothetical protein